MIYHGWMQPFPYPVFVLSEFADASGLFNPSAPPDGRFIEVYRVHRTTPAAFSAVSTPIEPGNFVLFTDEASFWHAFLDRYSVDPR